MTTTFEALMSVGTAAVPMVEEPPRPPMNSSPSIETGPVVAQPVRALSPLPPAESWGKPMAPASARVPEPHRPAYHYEVRAPKCDAKNKELEKQILMLKDEVRRLEDEKIRGTREIQALRNDAHSQREIIEELRQLLDLKTSELQSTSALLPGADSAAIADIIRLVESLNEDIFQTAAFMSDALEPIPRMAKERIQGEASRVREEGFHINLEDSQDPLQYIFQNCLIQNCQRTLDMWTASEMQSQNLRNLYEIVKGEGLAPSNVNLRRSDSFPRETFHGTALAICYETGGEAEVAATSYESRETHASHGRGYCEHVEHVWMGIFKLRRSPCHPFRKSGPDCTAMSRARQNH